MSPLHFFDVVSSPVFVCPGGTTGSHEKIGSAQSGVGASARARQMRLINPKNFIIGKICAPVTDRNGRRLVR